MRFRSSLVNEKFPSEWKKSNVIPALKIKKKKNNSQVLKDYPPISLLPVSGKIIERLDNSLISQNQSGFKPADSCVTQLLPIRHEIFESFDDGQDVLCCCFSVYLLIWSSLEFLIFLTKISIYDFFFYFYCFNTVFIICLNTYINHFYACFVTFLAPYVPIILPNNPIDSNSLTFFYQFVFK